MYTQAGNYTAFAGLAVILLAKVGVVTDAGSIASIIGAVVAVVGLVKQYIAHRKLAVSAGAIPE